jgi:hypothetical protein
MGTVKGGNKMTAQELIKIAKAEKPHIHYITNKKENAIAAMVDGLPVMVAGRMITGEWCTIGNLVVNGEPCVNDWED